MTSVPALRVVGLGKRFRQRRPIAQALRAPRGTPMVEALADISLEVGLGEFFGILGQNGAGKTTLFKILATLILPDTGRAEVFGYDVGRDAGRVRATLAPVIANERSLNWRLSAAENLRLFGALHHLHRREVDRRIDELLEIVDLVGAGARQVGLFSSGMKQRLLIARALVSQPRVLLLDEPTRSLDPVSAEAFRAFLRRDIAAGQGCTVVLATHDAEEVRDLCDRVAILHHGRVRATGSTEHLMARYGEARYRVWSLGPLPPAFHPAGAAPHPGGRPIPEVPGWFVSDVLLPGGPARAASFLADLHRAGVTVARLERVELSLADLLRRVAASDPDTSRA